MSTHHTEFWNLQNATTQDLLYPSSRLWLGPTVLAERKASECSKSLPFTLNYLEGQGDLETR